MKNIGLAVEGHGDVDAIPVLVRSILANQSRFDISVAPAIRVGGTSAVLSGSRFPKQFRFLANDPANCGVIIALDADDECPLALRSKIIQRIASDVGTSRVPVAVVLFNREYEALFLSQADILAGTYASFHAGDEEMQAIANSESVRNCKGAVGRYLAELSYKEVRDQAKLTARLDVNLLGTRHRAGKRLVSAIQQVLVGKSDLDELVTC